MQHLVAPPSLLHRLRIIASFVLLGTVLAGSLEILPAFASILPATFDLHAIGALLGGIAGAASQTMRQA
jgi:hypothetical protein